MLKTLRDRNEVLGEVQATGSIAGIEDKDLIDDAPEAKLEWSENKVAHTYTMTPEEYTQYVRDYILAINRARQSVQGKAGSDGYAAALETAQSKAASSVKSKYKNKFRKKAVKGE